MDILPRSKMTRKQFNISSIIKKFNKLEELKLDNSMPNHKYYNQAMHQ